MRCQVDHHSTAAPDPDLALKDGFRHRRKLDTPSGAVEGIDCCQRRVGRADVAVDSMTGLENAVAESLDLDLADGHEV